MEIGHFNIRKTVQIIIDPTDNDFTLWWTNIAMENGHL